jgi:hypothetical protein
MEAITDSICGHPNQQIDMSDATTLLDTFAAHVEKTPNKVFLTQPMGGGDANVKDWTFKQTMDEGELANAVGLVLLVTPKMHRILLRGPLLS